jgi:hypothetical protein
LNIDNSEQVLEGVCALLYADMLIKFLNTPVKNLKKLKNVICPYSEDINSKIISTFTMKSANGT